MFLVVSNYQVETYHSIPKEIENECAYLHEDQMQSLEEAILFANSMRLNLIKADPKYLIKIFQLNENGYKCVWKMN